MTDEPGIHLQLPITFEMRHPARTMFVVLSSLLVPLFVLLLVAIVVLLCGSHKGGDGKFPALMFLIIACIKSGIVPLCLHMATRKTVTTLDEGEISREVRSLFMYRIRREPLRLYRGIAKDQRTVAVGGLSVYTSLRALFHLTLIDRDEKKRPLLIYEQKRDSGLRPLMEALSERLGLPILEKMPDGYRAQPTENLGKSVDQLAGENRLVSRPKAYRKGFKVLPDDRGVRA